MSLFEAMGDGLRCIALAYFRKFSIRPHSVRLCCLKMIRLGFCGRLPVPACARGALGVENALGLVFAA